MGGQLPPHSRFASHSDGVLRGMTAMGPLLGGGPFPFVLRHSKHGRAAAGANLQTVPFPFVLRHSKHGRAAAATLPICKSF